MKRIFLILSFNLMINSYINSQTLPEGFILQYQQDFSNDKSLNDFRYMNPECWKTVRENKKAYLAFLECRIDSIQTLNRNQAVLDSFIFGDFILEASFVIPVNDSGRGNISFLFGIRDSVHYYNLNLNISDSHISSSIEIMDGNKPVRIILNDTLYSGAKINKWHKVRLVRDIVEKTITFYLDDLTKPSFTLKDRSFIMGYIGFGLMEEGKLYSIKIWSQTAIPQGANFFKQKI